MTEKKSSRPTKSLTTRYIEYRGTELTYLAQKVGPRACFADGFWFRGAQVHAGMAKHMNGEGVCALNFASLDVVVAQYLDGQLRTEPASLNDAAPCRQGGDHAGQEDGTVGNMSPTHTDETIDREHV